MSSTQTSEIPPKVLSFLLQGGPAILATVGPDDWPHTVMTWVTSRDSLAIRFAGDVGSTTMSNLERKAKATLQIIGPDDILFLIKGHVQQIKAQVESTDFPISVMEMTVTEVKNQSWPGVIVSPVSYHWIGEHRDKMIAMEQAMLAELRVCEPQPSVANELQIP